MRIEVENVESMPKLLISYYMLVIVTNHSQIQTHTNPAPICIINGGLNSLLFCVLSHKFNIKIGPSTPIKT